MLLSTEILLSNIDHSTYQEKYEIDEIIKDYVLKNDKYKFLTRLDQHKISMLYKLYGNKRSITIYRGICFCDKDDYLAYLQCIQRNNQLDLTGKVASWTKDFEIAKAYSLVDGALEYNDRKLLLATSKTDDSYGLIIKQTIKPNQAIVVPYIDANRFAYEKEVITIGGIYSIELVDYDVLIKN